MRRIRTACLLAGLICASFLSAEPVHAQTEWADWIADAEIESTVDDNINHGAFASEKLSDSSYTPSLTAGRILQLADYSRLSLTGRYTAELHNDFRQLSSHNIGGSLAIQHKSGLGPFVPWLHASASAMRIHSRSNIRDGQSYIFGLQAGKRLNDRLSLRLAYSHDIRKGPASSPVNGISPNPGGRVFDMQGDSGSLGLGALLTQSTLLRVGYSFRRGDIVATRAWHKATASSPYVLAVTTDDAMPGTAYRLKAQVHTYRAGISHSFLAGHASAEIGYERRSSKTGLFTYTNNIVRANVMYSY